MKSSEIISMVIVLLVLGVSCASFWIGYQAGGLLLGLIIGIGLFFISGTLAHWLFRKLNEKI